MSVNSSLFLSEAETQDASMAIPSHVWLWEKEEELRIEERGPSTVMLLLPTLLSLLVCRSVTEVSRQFSLISASAGSAAAEHNAISIYCCISTFPLQGGVRCRNTATDMFSNNMIRMTGLAHAEISSETVALHVMPQGALLMLLYTKREASQRIFFFQIIFRARVQETDRTKDKICRLGEGSRCGDERNWWRVW